MDFSHKLPIMSVDPLSNGQPSYLTHQPRNHHPSHTNHHQAQYQHHYGAKPKTCLSSTMVNVPKVGGGGDCGSYFNGPSDSLSAATTSTATAPTFQSQHRQPRWSMDALVPGSVATAQQPSHSHHYHNGQQLHSQNQHHSHNILNANAKSLESKSLQKMNCFPKQRFTPYTGRFMTSTHVVPVTGGTSAHNMMGTSVDHQASVVPLSSAASSSSSVLATKSHSSSNFNRDLDAILGEELPHQSSKTMETDMSHLSTSTVSNSSTGSASGGSNCTFNTSNSKNDSGLGVDLPKKVMLQLNNLDSSYDEASLKNFLMSLLKPITPIVSLHIDGNSSAKIEVPSPHFAKSVISQLHRKKIGRKRLLVSYCKETINDISTLGYQVAGLLKDVPFYTLPLNKFRELFQARFKSSISVLELYKMLDVCHIRTDENEEKHISLNQDFLAKIEESPFNPNMQHSIPYCARHFKRENYKGWAEQELEPLPNVFLTLNQVQNIVYRLLQTHKEGIPVASILHCVDACLGITVTANDNGINLEHLLGCVKGVQIENNVYGIKIICWSKMSEKKSNIPDIYDGGDSLFYPTNNHQLTPAQQLAKDVIELLKICPKATMNFSKFVPAYHNYFGKQCRVADYGYTKLIELFEGMSSVIQVLGEGNNRLITLIHRIQVRRFGNDLLKTIKWQVNKSVLLSQLPHLLAFTLNHTFSITDYGVCSLTDMLEELEANGQITTKRIMANGSTNDILISLPKHKQTVNEMENTLIFAAEIVDLCRNMPQYEIMFQKFVKSYYYHYGYHCRLSDYGFQKLAELFEAIDGLIKLDPSNDENRKIALVPTVARRIFAEQVNDVVQMYSKRKGIRVPLVDVMNLFRSKFGYSMIPQTLGCNTIDEMMRCLPFIEINDSEKDFFIISHYSDPEFRKKCLMVCLLFIHLATETILYTEFYPLFYQKYNEYLTESYLRAMKHIIEIRITNDVQIIMLTKLAKYILWVASRLDTKITTSMKSLKSQLNVQMSTYFELGYPNLSSFLAAFPEVFILHPKPTENCDVRLQSQFFIPKKEIVQFFGAANRTTEDQSVPTYGLVTQPPIMANQSAQVAPTFSLYSNQSDLVPPTNEPMYQSVRAQSAPVVSYTPSYQATTQFLTQNTSANINYMCPSSNVEATTATAKQPMATNWATSKWLKGIKKDYIPLSIQSLYYEPPKPDTPPSKLWPFGFDPVWSDQLDSPQVESVTNTASPQSPTFSQWLNSFQLNIQLPELSVNVPVVNTPVSLKMATESYFNFDDK